MITYVHGVFLGESWKPFFLAIHGSKYRLHDRHHEEFKNVGNWDLENGKKIGGRCKKDAMKKI